MGRATSRARLYIPPLLLQLASVGTDGVQRMRAEVRSDGLTAAVEEGRRQGRQQRRQTVAR